MYKLRIQMVLYKNTIPQLRTSLDSVILATKAVSKNFQIVLGSNSCDITMNRKYVNLVQEYSDKVAIEIHCSQENIGHGAMHNKLFFEAFEESELLLIINPDGIIGPTSLTTMVNLITPKDVGAVEPRQLPFEHPKKFDITTGETSWASGACLLTKSAMFEKLEGFDKRFFLHCDDVDLSWRIRNQGLKLIYSAESRFFHDKTVAKNGHPETSESESFYGPLGALLIAHKYNLKKGLRYMLRDLGKSTEILHKEILKAYTSQSVTLSTLRIAPEIPKYINPWKFSETKY